MAENFIDMTNRAFRGGSDFPSTEFVAFLELVEAESSQHYDAMKVIDALGTAVLSCRAFKRLIKMLEDGETFVRIMTKALRYCSYSSLMYAFYICGYSDLAGKMKHRGKLAMMFLSTREGTLSVK